MAIKYGVLSGDPAGDLEPVPKPGVEEDLGKREA
jgi:hypothetical protein